MVPRGGTRTTFDAPVRGRFPCPVPGDVATDVQRAIRRIGHEILERNQGLDGVVLVGLQTGGVPLADRIADALDEIEGTRPPTGCARRRALPRRHRAAPGARPRPSPTSPFDVNGASSCWSTTCSSPVAPCAPRSTRSTPTAARGRCSSRSWSIAATASCRSAPTTWARTCPTRRDEVVDVHDDGVDIGGDGQVRRHR